jgi:plasmid stabilization system protein ParE
MAGLVPAIHVFRVFQPPSAPSVLTAALQSLDVFPERGRPVGARNVRELIVRFGQSSYIVRYAYRQQDDEVVVLRIWHSREARE